MGSWLRVNGGGHGEDELAYMSWLGATDNGLSQNGYGLYMNTYIYIYIYTCVYLYT